MNKKSLKSKKFIFGVSCLLLCIVSYVSYKSISGGKQELVEDRVPVVKTASAKIMPICRFLKLTGVLKPNNSVEIKSEVDSTISKILFTEGSNVEKGDLLVQLDDSRAASALREAEAQYAKIKTEYVPSNALASKGVISKVKRDMLKADLDSAAARIETCKVNLAKHKIFAPFSGKMGLKEVSEGQYVGNGAMLTKIVDNEQLRVDFKVPDINISEIYQGQALDISVDNNEKGYTAIISAIDPESDKMSHSFNVRAILNGKADIMLKPGMFVKVSIALDKCKNGIVVPESALELFGDVQTVLRVSETGNAMRTSVIPGFRTKGFVEITSGLTEGETVIIEGHGRVQDGRPVKYEQNSKKSK